MKRSFTFLVCLMMIWSVVYGQVKYPVFKGYDHPGTKDREKAMIALEQQAYRTGVEEFDQVIHRNRLGLKSGESYRCLDFHFRRGFHRFDFEVTGNKNDPGLTRAGEHRIERSAAGAH